MTLEEPRSSVAFDDNHETIPVTVDDMGVAGDVKYLPPPEDIIKKKIAGLAKTWLRFDQKGNPQWVKADKHALQHQLGVPMRDLRLLEPKKAVGGTTAILARDRVLVVKLEHIRAIICSDQVLLLNAEDEDVKPLVPELQARLAGISPQTPAEGGVLSGQWLNMAPEKEAAPPKKPTAVAELTASVKNMIGASVKGMQGAAGKAAGKGLGGDKTPVGGIGGGPPLPPAGPPVRKIASLSDMAGEFALELPYELRALEVLLENVVAYMEKNTSDLESATHPALDALTKKVTTSNLERVRKVKSRLTRLSGRVTKINVELERFLDDDSDMREMYLTRKAEERQAEKQKEQEKLEEMKRRITDPQGSAPTTPGAAMGAGGLDGAADGEDREEERDIVVALRDLEDDADVAEVEMLLETYFMMVDSISNRLNNLTEYVDNTEDYVNIDLDYHRNQLIQLELLLTTATFAITLVAVISGIFGMNIRNELEENDSSFKLVTGLSCTLSLFTFGGILAYCRHQRLMLV